MIEFLQEKAAQVTARFDQFLKVVASITVANPALPPLQQKLKFETNLNAAKISLSLDVENLLTNASLYMAGTVAEKTGSQSVETMLTLGQFYQNSKTETLDSIDKIANEVGASARHSFDLAIVANSRKSNLWLSQKFQDARILDSLNRSISAMRAVQLRTSGQLIKTWNTAMYFALMARGDELARIERHGHDDNGQMFKLTTFPDIEREKFHPNSWSFIVPYL